MAAKDYKLCYGIFGAYIAKVSKRNPNQTTSDIKVLTVNEVFDFIRSMVKEFCVRDDTDTMYITENGGPMLELKASGVLLQEIKDEVNEEKENDGRNEDKGL